MKAMNFHIFYFFSDYFLNICEFIENYNNTYQSQYIEEFKKQLTRLFLSYTHAKEYFSIEFIKIPFRKHCSHCVTECKLYSFEIRAS